MAIVCMVNSSEYVDLNSSVLPTDGVSISEAKEESLADMLTNKSISKRNKALRLDWNADEQGYIFGAFNLGLLSMLGTGLVADKFNAKYMIIASVLIASMANLIIATASSISVYFAISGRLLVGISDALLQPSVNSLITRWFSPAERSYALGLATGGRQLEEKTAINEMNADSKLKP
ncbi:unnamed protein product [Toxocara canis]|uniref:MFS domain-containing protein n=1 Tax=Toxocara canis TaxID=6265 RepID=A0A183U1K2_TOXCA|nr:unnamed protein product [Toxocara canis]